MYLLCCILETILIDDINKVLYRLFIHSKVAEKENDSDESRDETMIDKVTFTFYC